MVTNKMVSVDEHTRVAIEVVSQGTKLSGELLLKLLKKLNEMLANDKEKENYVLKDNTKEGKQKINDLIKKHKDGVNSLDDNLTKEQVKDYAKELKKVGIDFSVVKNGKDNYSFYFAGKDAAILEKGLKNIVERKSLENEKSKGLTNEKETKSPSVFSIQGIKAIDKKIKEQQQDQKKDKKRDQSLSR